MWPIKKFWGSNHITGTAIPYHPQKGRGYGHVTVLKICRLPWCSALRGFVSDSWATCWNYTRMFLTFFDVFSKSKTWLFTFLNCCTRFFEVRTLISRSRDMVGAYQNSNGSRALTTTLSMMIRHQWASTCYHQPTYQIWSLTPLIQMYEIRYKMSKMGWLVSWSLTSPFTTNMAISETQGQEWRAVKEGQRYINLNPGRLFVQQPPKRERDWETHLNYYASAYSRGRQLSHRMTKLNQIQQKTINLNYISNTDNTIINKTNHATVAARVTSNRATVTVFVTVWTWPLTFWPLGQCMPSDCYRVHVYQVWWW